MSDCESTTAAVLHDLSPERNVLRGHISKAALPSVRPRGSWVGALSLSVGRSRSRACNSSEKGGSNREATNGWLAGERSHLLLREMG